MEMSIYDMHHIIAKYLGLRRYVYVVSDCVVFFCSFLCCQCAQYFTPDMSAESLSEASSAMYQMIPRKVEVYNKDLSYAESSKSQHIMIDFEQTEPKSNIQKCTELWSLVDEKKELEWAVPDSNFTPPPLTNLTDSPGTNKKQIINERRDDYPTVHTTVKQQDQVTTLSTT